jgi:hypothetical protein
MRTRAPDLLPLFRSEFQVELLALLLLEPGRAWTIPQMAERLDSPNSSVHRELGRAERAGIIDRDSGSRPHTFRAAEESPLYRPLADLFQLTVGGEEVVIPAQTEIRQPSLCHRVADAISPRQLVTGVLRRAWRLAAGS